MVKSGVERRHGGGGVGWRGTGGKRKQSPDISIVRGESKGCPGVITFGGRAGSVAEGCRDDVTGGPQGCVYTPTNQSIAVTTDLRHGSAQFAGRLVSV